MSREPISARSGGWYAREWSRHAKTTVVVDDPGCIGGIRVIAECDTEESARLISAAPQLHRELNDSIKAVESVARQLDDWANESQRGGWSTHQVDPMRRLADILRRQVDGWKRCVEKAEGRP